MNERWLALAVVTGLLLLNLARLGGFPFQDPDEGRYAEIAREMLESGDWVTPRLNYVTYFEKPPLFYWLLSASMSVFGATEAAARLVSALSALGSLAIVYLLGCSLFGRRAALLSVALLATMPIFFVVGQVVVIDMTLTLFTTATLAAVWGLHARPDQSSRWTLAVALAAALGTLSKGLVAVVLPGLIALAFLVWQRDWPALRALLRPIPVLVFAAVVTPWFALISRAEPSFLEIFFVREHLARFAGRAGHTESIFFYVLPLVLGTLPWIGFGTLAARPDGRAAFRALPGPAASFVGIWFLAMFVFFSAAQSKLVTYLVPALPALALLLAAWVDRSFESVALARVIRGIAYGFAVACVAGLIASGVASASLAEIGARYDVSASELRTVLGSLVTTSVALGIGGAIALRSPGRPGICLAALATTMALALFAAAGVREVVRNTRGLAEAIATERQPGDAIVGYKRLYQGLGFYTGARMIQVQAAGETEDGMELAPDREQYFWEDPALLAALWGSGRGVFVATDLKFVPELSRLLDPAPRIVRKAGGLVLLTNRPQAPERALDEAPER